MAKIVSDEILKQYAIDFSEEIRAVASANGENDELAILSIIKDKLGECKIINDPQFFYWSYSFGRNKITLYGYDIDEFDNSVSLFVSDIGEPFHTILQRDAQVMIDEALNFIKFAMNGKSDFTKLLENDAYDLYDQLVQLNKTPVGLTKIKVIIVSNGKHSSRAKVELSPMGNIDVELLYWDIEWIYSNCNSIVTMEDIVIDAKEDDYCELMDGGLPCLPVPQTDETFECYQCVVPGKLLATIYRRFGSPLLEGNVRSFLTTKTSVNKEIQGTISKEPARFYVYNNGIAAIASSVKVELINGLQRITRIEKIQIVNGGQTTASLAYSAQKRGADLAQISVPMKLTVIKAENEMQRSQLDDLIQKISETSNSQNKVTAVDFFANHPFHLKIKNFSERISQPGAKYSTYWFYERARGEYAQALMFKTKVQQDSFKMIHPVEKMLTKTDFAKYYNLMNKHPDQVSKGGDSNFKLVAEDIRKEWVLNQSKFNEMFFKEVVSVGILYRELEPKITKKNLPWFMGSYRANVIVYAIASLLWMVESSDDKFDLQKVWDKGLTKNFLDDLLELCHKIYDILTDPNRPVENVTQYCKKKECWENVKKALAGYKFPSTSLTPYLVSKYAYTDKKKEARTDQKFEDEVEAYSLVTRFPYKGHWMLLMQYLEKNRKLFPELSEGKIKMIMKVVNMDSGKMGKAFPDGKDCAESVKWWKEAEKMGWQV